VNIAQLIALAQALEPFIAPAEVTVEAIIGAIRGAGGMTEDEADADLRALIGEALQAKADADREANG
jgi:hypothetical protein